MIVTSDLHLTAKTEDEYRWGLFDFLKTVGNTDEDLYILGDLTDSKDRHPSYLVNRIVRELSDVSKYYNQVFIMKGNHDYIDKETPFFDFLNGYQGIQFVSAPKFLPQSEVLLLPHTRHPETEWINSTYEFMNAARITFMHQSFEGAVASNGMLMDGLLPSDFKDVTSKIYSGDIHVPQNLGPITYVGSPYHVHFGDSFVPRILKIEGGKETNLYFKTLKKLSVKIHRISDLKDYDLHTGDQLKVTFVLPRSEFSSWTSKRDEMFSYCAAEGIQLFGIDIQERKRARLSSVQSKEPEVKQLTDSDVFTAFCSKENLAKSIVDEGLRYL